MVSGIRCLSEQQIQASETESLRLVANPLDSTVVWIPRPAGTRIPVSETGFAHVAAAGVGIAKVMSGRTAVG